MAAQVSLGANNYKIYIYILHVSQILLKEGKTTRDPEVQTTSEQQGQQIIYYTSIKSEVHE
jgi:hypothetical protein